MARRGKSRELVTYTRGYIDKLKYDARQSDSSVRYWRNQANARLEERDHALTDLQEARAAVAHLTETTQSAIRQRDEAEKHAERLARTLVATVTLAGESVGLEVRERR